MCRIGGPHWGGRPPAGLPTTDEGPSPSLHRPAKEALRLQGTPDGPGVLPVLLAVALCAVSLMALVGLGAPSGALPGVAVVITAIGAATSRLRGGRD